MQKASSHPLRGSYTLYAIGCRYYFTPLAGVLFTFPSRYLFTIGCQGVFSLIRWSGQIHAEFHVHRVTWDPSRGCSNFRALGSHHLWPAFPCRYASSRHLPYLRSLNPGKTSPPGLGSSAFARHYLRNHSRFLFLGLLRCFTSPRFASPDYEFIWSIIGCYTNWVVPFGNPRITACLRLPVAYRNLLRPSSPLGTKAFTISP